ncbi:MAG: hypothetical protein Q4Q23_05795 [Methanobacteriaceae archaeon]|nr:hypothetical protein [Methanobacteriaceae archaeon]
MPEEKEEFNKIKVVEAPFEVFKNVGNLNNLSVSGIIHIKNRVSL